MRLNDIEVRFRVFDYFLTMTVCEFAPFQRRGGATELPGTEAWPQLCFDGFDGCVYKSYSVIVYQFNNDTKSIIQFNFRFNI